MKLYIGLVVATLTGEPYPVKEHAVFTSFAVCQLVTHEAANEYRAKGHFVLIESCAAAAVVGFE